MSDGTAGQLLEDFIRALNGNVFLREFAVSSGRIDVPAGEVEIADTMVLLRGLVLVYQLKEREPDADCSEAALQRWFERKISGVAVGQIAGTLAYLRDHAGQAVTNDRGHTVALPVDVGVLASLVIYRAESSPSFRGLSGRTSSRAGFVHFFEASDYFDICAFLRTPVEIAKYLGFRQVGLGATEGSREVSERALLGQFLLEASGPPDERYAEAFDHLVDVGEDHDLSFILQNLGDRVDYRSGDESDTSHYAILQELASLPRTGLAAFKARLKLCVEAVRSGEFRNPTHFADPAGDCGFLITPWDTHLGIPQEAYLRTLTELSKYSFGAGRQVGVCVSLESEALYILWCHIKRPHVVDTSLDAALAADDCPLPPTAARNIPTYDFDTEGLERLLSSDDE